MIALACLLAATLVFVATRRLALSALEPVAGRASARRALAPDRLASAAPDRRAVARAASPARR